MGSFRSWLRLLRSADGIDAGLWPRAFAVAATTLATSPLRCLERGLYGRSVRHTVLHPAPIFVLGHWRTGTTHLHNLLCQDPRFGFLSTFQAMAPGFCLLGEKRLKSWLEKTARREHPTREIDNIPLAFDAPQEEAFALANMVPQAWLHMYALPRQAEEIFARYALLHGLSRRERAEWTEAYLTVLRKATLRSRGRRLVLKDPANTGRIGVLLDLFPAAKFVHICRDPYRVLPSMVGVYKVVLPKAQLQRIPEERITELVLRFYEELLHAYEAEKALIPAGNLVEVRYEDLETRPLDVLREIYEGLSLPSFDETLPHVRAYLDTVRGFEKNAYTVDDAVIARVNERWGFAFDLWGYPRLSPSKPAALSGTK